MDDMDGIRRRPVVDQIFGDNRAPIEAVLTADFGGLVRLVEDAEAMSREANTRPRNDAEQAALGEKIMDLRSVWRRIDGARETEKKPLLEATRGLDGWFGALKARVETAVKPLSDGADAYVRQKAAEARARAEREAAEARARAEEERRKAEAAKTAAGAARAEGRAELHDARADAAEAVAAASVSDLTRAKVGGVTTGGREYWTARVDDYNAAIAPLGVLGAYLKRDAVEAALVSLARVQRDAARWPGVHFGPEQRAAFRR